MSRVNAELVRLRAGKCLRDSKKSIELRTVHPALFFNQFTASHTDLSHRSAERQQSEPNEPQEQSSVCENRRQGFSLIC